MNAFFTGLTAPIQPYLFAIKCAILVAVLGFVGYKAWELRGDLAQHEMDTAVRQQANDDQKIIDDWRARAQAADQRSDAYLAQMEAELHDLSTKFGSIRTATAKEIQSDPQFYGQSLPAGGYAQWLAARNLTISLTPISTASAPSSSASTPSGPMSSAYSSPWSSLFARTPPAPAKE